MAFNGHLKLFLCNIFVKSIEKLVERSQFPLGNGLSESLILDTIHYCHNSHAEEAIFCLESSLNEPLEKISQEFIRSMIDIKKR